LLKVAQSVSVKPKSVNTLQGLLTHWRRESRDFGHLQLG
jgi:hypothetical protein